MSEQHLNEKQTQTVIHECEACGGTMEYDIKSGNLKCAHCGSIALIDQKAQVERKEISEYVLKDHGNWNETSVFRCENCGAKEVLDKKDISHVCCFCGSSHVVSTKELPGIKPDAVIPFQITRESAVERFRKWIKSRWLAPKVFKTSDIREHINGIYCSSWSFSAKTENTYVGKLGKYETVYRRDSSGKSVAHRETRWFNVNGRINESYTDYFVQSGARITPGMFAKIKPFNLKLIRVYSQEYLAGICAEHYTKNLETCFTEFANYIKMDLRRKIMNRHNADTVSTLDIKTHYASRKFNYVLLPIYIANYLYNKKTYNFYVNGASGVVVGKYPKSKLKIALISIGAGLLIGGILVAGWFLGLFS